MQRAEQVDGLMLSSALQLDLDGQQLNVEPQLRLKHRERGTDADLQIDQVTAARLNSQWRDGQHWQGSLQIPDWPQTPGCLATWAAGWRSARCRSSRYRLPLSCIWMATGRGASTGVAA
ncbi:hypothetical protein ULF88_11960 [Halopseudomonas pachastrellae]|nr:hypothetical protein [Halopseudomonas pachastrellae]